MHYYVSHTRGRRCVLRLKMVVQGMMTLVAVLALAAIVGCGSSASPKWVDADATYATSSLPGVFDKADISKYKDRPVAEAAELRHKALTALRLEGEDAARAADLITKTLPADSPGIPVYVERATVSGQPAYILVEAIGPTGGRLTVKRIWALADSGAVLWVGTR